MTLEFGAPWSRSLKTASVLAGFLFVGMATAGILIMPTRLAAARFFLVGGPLVALASAFLTMVSGYTLTAAALEVRRPLWSTVFPLADLQSVAGDAKAFSGAFRLFGNGGLFSFTGFFWSRRLGCFRALATDPARAVILKFRRRTLVITPDDTQRFIVRVRTHLATGAH
jgi:PH (Pleckstrin Homology) domain-containing protein